ncbi:MAG: hypothetical protein M0Q92_10895 [Methanoregula sp.]|jgi:hypothetical protein|nr:hypothetical protein [Methanoregula sp.]
MVNSGGQLYTIEGIAAGLIILVSAFIVVNSTSVYTMGDTHISDMQLEVLGSDALAMMDTAPNSSVGKSPLQAIVETDDSETFRTMFDNIVNNKTGTGPDRIQFAANVTYVTPNGWVNSSALSESVIPRVGGEHTVRVSEWLIVDKAFPGCNTNTCKWKHAVLVEVLLWRD